MNFSFSVTQFMVLIKIEFIITAWLFHFHCLEMELHLGMLCLFIWLLVCSSVCLLHIRFLLVGYCVLNLTFMYLIFSYLSLGRRFVSGRGNERPAPIITSVRCDGHIKISIHVIVQICSTWVAHVIFHLILLPFIWVFICHLIFPLIVLGYLQMFALLLMPLLTIDRMKFSRYNRQIFNNIYF